MPISARNKLSGKIEEIQLGDVIAHVVVRVGDNFIESAITRRSADELKLKKGGDFLAGGAGPSQVKVGSSCLLSAKTNWTFTHGRHQTSGFGEQDGDVFRF
jgi:molybdopterin-binding protein